MDRIPYTIINTDTRTLTAIDEYGNREIKTGLPYELYLRWLENIYNSFLKDRELLQNFPNQGGLI